MASGCRTGSFGQSGAHIRCRGEPQRAAQGGTGLGANATEAYVCVHRVVLLRQPETSQGEEADADAVVFGTRLNVKEVKGSWVKVALPGEETDGWIHRALVCGDGEMVRKKSD